MTSAAATWAAMKTGLWAAEPAGSATRGVVLYPFDLTLADWPDRAARAGLTTIALHAARRLDVLVKFMQSDEGQRFTTRCQQLGLNIEYELHAMGDLLSREYFGQDETMFRMDADSRRRDDFNCCPSHPRALEIIAQAAVEFGTLLRPKTHRYFYWPDDGRAWCHCDVSRFSSWRRPATKLPWHRDVLQADLASYRRRGIRHITSFACFIDAEYVRMHGDPQEVLAEYGQLLRASVSARE